MPYLSQRACRRAIAIAVVSAVASLGTAALMPGIARAAGTAHPGGHVSPPTTTITPYVSTPTQLTVNATPASVPFGSTSTLAETLLPANRIGNGTVTFFSGSATLCTVQLAASSCTTSPALAAGAYAIVAFFSGANSGGVEYMGSSATTALTVTALTSFTASAAPPSVAVGSTSNLTETGLPGTATGTVGFTSGGAVLCIATLPATTCAYAALLAAGAHAIVATYGGDSTFAGSTATTMLTVTLVETSTRVTSSRNPAELGQKVIYTADVVSNPGSGTVTFTAHGLPIAGCTAVGINPSSGSATCSASYSTAGVQRIGATFSGNAAFAASSTATTGVLALTETVVAAVAVPTTGAGAEGNPAQPLAGGLLALLGLLTVLGARRLRSRPESE